MAGKLYIVATPLGNLGDITLRALETLRAVDIILCEDTRVTKKLLAHYEIQKPTISFHEHSGAGMVKKIIEKLRAGENLAFVTDAGTPGISDPGARLVASVRAELSEAKIVPIPGASAVVAAASASGINTDHFLFLGFPPHKKGRQTFFKTVAAEFAKWPVIFYESPHRIQKAFAELAINLGEDVEIIVARELTKMFEEIWRGTSAEAQKYFIGEHSRGEFVVIIPQRA